jgi:hypothetical protein
MDMPSRLRLSSTEGVRKALVFQEHRLAPEPGMAENAQA